MKNYDVGAEDKASKRKLSYNLNDDSKKRLSYNLNAPVESDSNDGNGGRKFQVPKWVKGCIVAALIVVPCVAFGVVMWNGYNKTEQAYAEAEREYVDLAMSYVTEIEDDGSGSGGGDEYMSREVDFEQLKTVQEDIYAWISIPETNVEYPILQSGADKKDDNYWLNHNLDGSYGYPGTIFTERMFGKDFKTFNTVIYGHNMKNKTMFGQLHEFVNQEYFDAHRYVYIYTETMTYKYEIVSASTISDVHLAVGYNGYKTETQRKQFLEYLQSNSTMQRDVNTGIYDNYITLSTCTNSDTNRWVILAKCVDKVSATNFD